MHAALPRQSPPRFLLPFKRTYMYEMERWKDRKGKREVLKGIKILKIVLMLLSLYTANIMVKKVSKWPRKSVSHDNLMFDRKNPRLRYEMDENMSQEQLYSLLIQDFDVKRLAEQMNSDGFHNSEILIVVK